MSFRSISSYAIVLIVSSIFLVQCQNKKTNGAFTVTVAYKNADRMIQRQDTPDLPDSGGHSKTPLILLEEIPYGGDMTPVILDSGVLNKNSGQLVLKGKAKEESIYQLEVRNGPLLLLINDGENINIDLDLSKQEDYYTVKGSEGSQMLKDFIRQYSEKTILVNQAFASLDSLKQISASDSLLIVATGKKNMAIAEVNRFLQEFISRSTHPALSLFALGWSSRSFPQADFEKSLNETIAKFPEHEVLRSVKATYEMQKAQMSEQQADEVESWVGKQAPELALPTADGKLLSIASFRGKYLLVDFWASWCGPCRQENPNVVKAFNQFKNKNFTILGVSLDREKDAWLQAIQDDGLQWSHISDLNYWDSKAAEVFKIKGIPFNVLVDPKGNIIAENLVGFELEKKLGEVLQ